MRSTIEDTLKHAQFLARHLNKCGPQCAIVAVLLELDISTKGPAFEYLKRAIILFSIIPLN